MRLKTFCGIVGCVMMAACGSDGGTAPTRPAIARLVLADSNFMVFGGAKLPLAKMVTAYDASGNVIAGPTLAVTMPAGFARVGDTIIAPTFESRGAIHISAAGASVDRGTNAASFDRASFDVLPSDTAVIQSIFDLRTRGWQATWGCKWGGIDIGNGGGIPENGVAVDSAFYTATVDTVYYPADSTKPWISQDLGGALAQLPWHAREVRYKHGTPAPDTVDITGTTAMILVAPDSMMFQVGVPSTVNSVWTTRTNPGQTPRTYAGGTWCNMLVWKGAPYVLYAPATVFTQTR